jgi:hypothetical protein
MEDLTFKEFISINKFKILNELVKFNNNLRPFYSNTDLFYSYFGINYNDKGVTSIKFYYVFFDILNFNRDFPIPELKVLFQESIQTCSNHINQYLADGGGITLAIKFDSLGNRSVGYYLRKSGDNESLASNIINTYSSFNLKQEDFDSGYGEYVMLIKNKLEKNEYIYLKNVEKLMGFFQPIGIDLNFANCIEIGSANLKDINAHKFIAIGGPELIGDSFKKNLPKDFIELLDILQAKLICPAVYNKQNKYTCYAYKKNNNLVENFINLYL